MTRSLGGKCEVFRGGWANQVAKALKFVQLGELSAGRHALEGVELAPRTTTTLRALRNRPTTPLDAIPELLCSILMKCCLARMRGQVAKVQLEALQG